MTDKKSQPDPPEASPVTAPLEPGAEGTAAATIDVAGDPRPHPTAAPPRPRTKSGETDAKYDGYQGEPILVSGSAGDEVRELCRRLDDAGYDTAVSRGEADAILSNDVYGQVMAFRRKHDVDDELAEAGEAIIGPATWAALARETT